MKAWLLAMLAVVWFVQPAFAGSRDFSESRDQEQLPPPRSGPLFVSFGLGADLLYAHWHEFNPIVHGDATQAGPAVRLRGGFVVHEGVAIFAEGYATAPLLPPLTGLDVAGLGVGMSWFLGASEAWHLDLTARRAWAHKSMFDSTGILLTPPPIDTIPEIWFGELGFGHASRSGHWDGGWTVAASGGPVTPAGSSGWGIALSASYFWSRW